MELMCNTEIGRTFKYAMHLAVTRKHLVKFQVSHVCCCAIALAITKHVLYNL